MPRVEILRPREVPLGGLRPMTVRRTLPQRRRSMIGAWSYLDHFGPDDVAETGGMLVPPHPHIGVQSVTWLFAGEIEHRDSAGNHALVRPGEVNLMTAGRGVCHSEVSTDATGLLHGVQLWVALPAGARHCDPAFDHHLPTPVRGPGWEARVFMGSAFGTRSPVRTFTPLLGAEVMLAPGATLELAVDPEFEHGVLVDVGQVSIGDEKVEAGDLAYVAPGEHRLQLLCHDEARVLLLGGPPFEEPVVMWWNFIGRGHEEIVAARLEWQRQVTRDGELVADATEATEGRFGVVSQHLPPIAAPEMPGVRLRPRR